MVKDPENIVGILGSSGTGTGLEIGVDGGMFYEDTFKFKPYKATVPQPLSRIDVDTFEVEIRYLDGGAEKGKIIIDKMETYPESEVIFEFKGQKLVGRMQLFIKEMEDGQLKQVSTKHEAY